MSIKILESAPRADGTVDVLFELDGNTERWIGVPVEIASVPIYLEAYVMESRMAQPTMPELPGVE
jgi:hypothetical protein